MKVSVITASVFSILFLLSSANVFAGVYPDGDITFQNASDHAVRAEVSPTKSFTLATNESRTIPYRSLSWICSDSPTSCRAQFYVNDTPVGSATINSETGKLVNMKMAMKIKTSKNDQNVLRAVVIK